MTKRTAAVVAARALCLVALCVVTSGRAEAQPHQGIPTPVHEVSNGGPEGGDELSILSAPIGNLGLHIACVHGETKVMLYTPGLADAGDRVLVNDRVGIGPVMQTAWLTGVDHHTLIYNGEKPYRLLQTMLLGRSYTVRLNLPKGVMMDSHFDTTTLGAALRRHGAACDWAQLAG